jgi:hypothetical protein
MSERQRQKKAGEDKGKRNRARRRAAEDGRLSLVLRRDQTSPRAKDAVRGRPAAPMTQGREHSKASPSAAPTSSPPAARKKAIREGKTP